MRPNVFLPFGQSPQGAMTAVMRTANDPRALTGPVRDAVRQLNPDLPLFQIETMGDKLDRSLWTRRMYSWLFGLFAGLALLLAVAGTYGVVAYSVSQRTREIAIRMALGAEPAKVMRQVLGQGMRLVIVGIALGVAGAFGAAKLLEKLLFGVDGRNPVIYGIVALGVIAVALLANFLPARRASTVDPMSALRFE
jgi:ABC-type antimicrobial peptide transport system permease subunit